MEKNADTSGHGSEPEALNQQNLQGYEDSVQPEIPNSPVVVIQRKQIHERIQDMGTTIRQKTQELVPDNAKAIINDVRTKGQQMGEHIVKKGQEFVQVDAAKALSDVRAKGQQMGEHIVRKSQEVHGDAKKVLLDAKIHSKRMLQKSQDMMGEIVETGQEVVTNTVTRLKELPTLTIDSDALKPFGIRRSAPDDFAKKGGGEEVSALENLGKSNDVRSFESAFSSPDRQGSLARSPDSTDQFCRFSSSKSLSSPNRMFMSSREVEQRAYADYDPYLEKEERGKIKWREGRYKLGRKQFLSNPYIFIPAKMMLQPSFNFGHVLKDLGLAPPSLFFRLSRANASSTWNVKLPNSRLYLMKAFDKLHEAELKQGGNTNEGLKLNPKHTDLLIDPDLVGKAGDRESVVKKLKDGYEAIVGKAAVEESAYLHNLRGSIDHYRSVLDENCRRLLRSTNSACIQAQTIYTVNEVWSDEVHDDVVAQWVYESNPKGAAPLIFGFADKTDFHPDVWAQLRDGCVADYAQQVKDGREPAEVIIDPHPFFNGEIKIEYDAVSGHPCKSIPHPCTTHLIISDNRTLLEQKIAEVVLWGVIVINGGIREAELACRAVHMGLPVVAFKWTGGAADILIEMFEKVDKWVDQKRNKLLTIEELPPRPFPDDMQVGFRAPSWLMPFDQHTVVSCNLMNLLVENWPDRFNPTSFFVVDMFDTPEDEVQDRLTQTVGVVSGGDYELGGIASEQRRVSFAWRCRYTFLYNAVIYRWIADILQTLVVSFTMMSTIAATLYTYFAFVHSTRMYVNGSPRTYFYPMKASNYEQGMTWFAFINVILPLLATVVRGINSAISPYMKYVALQNACVRVESEIYAFRCKVGAYSALKQVDEDEDDEAEEGEEGGDDDDGGDDAGLPNPRKAFCAAMDRIWLDVSASDLQNGTLRYPRNPVSCLEDVNARISSNRREQETYLIPMMRHGGAEKSDAKKTELVEDDEGSGEGCLGYIYHLLQRSAKIATLQGDDTISLDDGVSPLTADRYVVIRLIPMAAYMTNAAPIYSYLRNIAQALSVTTAVMASALTAFDLIPFIPAVLAVGGSITAMTQYFQIDLRLLQTNSARSHLHQNIVWWEALSLIEKRVPANKTRLVKTTEAAIQSQATIFQGGGGGGGDDDGGDEAK